MKFEEFERKIWEKGYGIVAMNHYTIKGKRHTYCVVLGGNREKAFQSEAEDSEQVFDDIYNSIVNYKEQ